jgi:hypothetical protein
MAGEAVGADFSALVGRLDRLSGQLADSHLAWMTQVESNENRMRINRRIARRGNVVGLLGVVLAIVFGVQLHDANATNARNRTNSCLQAQDTARTSIEASDRGHEIEAAAIAPFPRTPRTQRAVDAALAAEHANTVKEWRIRDCTAQGVHDFLSRPPGPHAYLPPPPIASTTTGP